MVVCAGGGGIPVVRGRNGALSGVDAVIDKDLAAMRLATDVAADILLVLTDVPKAYVDYRGPNERALDVVTLPEMERYAAEGHFKAGSMGPKVEAAMRFVRGGGEAIIASLKDVHEAVAGAGGTHIVPTPREATKP
jgi:carbamate kinase